MRNHQSPSHGWSLFGSIFLKYTAHRREGKAQGCGGGERKRGEEREERTAWGEYKQEEGEGNIWRRGATWEWEERSRRVGSEVRK